MADQLTLDERVSLLESSVTTIAQWVHAKQESEAAEEVRREHAMRWIVRGAQGIGALVVGQAVTVWFPSLFAHWWAYTHGGLH